MFQCKLFSAYVKKGCFLILQGRVLTHARWSETLCYAEMRYSLLVNFMEKLSKSVNICKSCCIKFTAMLFMSHSVYLVLLMTYSASNIGMTLKLGYDSFKVIENGTIRQITYDLLFVFVTVAIYCVVCEIKQDIHPKIPIFYTPFHLSCTTPRNPTNFFPKF